MPLFKVSVRKAVNDAGGAFKWSNSYYVQTDTPGAAAVLGRAIWVNAEAVFHRSRVFCYEVYATTVAPGDNSYVILPTPEADQPGQIAGAGDQLPLFNVIRVDLPTVLPGRPSRKFYRPTLEEGDQTNGILTNATLLAALNAGLTYLWEEIPELADESNNLFNGYTIRGITSRRLGKFASVAVPPAPA